MTRRWGWALALPLVLILLVVGFSPANGAYALAPTSGLKYYDKTNASITVTWKRQSGINRYAIQYSTSSKFTNAKYSVPATVKTQADAFRQIGDLEPSTKYYFRIRATYSNGSNASDWSGAINITTSTYAFGAPSKPAISNVLSDRLDLSWSEVPNAGKYRVRYSTSSTFASGVSYDYPIDNKASISGLTPNTTYYFQVRGLESKVDDDGDPYLLTGYSSTASTSTNTFTTAPPEGFALEGSSKDKIVLKWKQVPGANGYRIQGALGTTKRYLDSDRIPASAPSGTTFSTSNGIVTATMTGYCDSGVAPAAGTCSAFEAGKTYIFRVTAMNNGERISDYTNAAGLKVVASSYPLSTPNDFKVVTSTENSVTLSWTKIPGATSYRIQQSKASSMSSARYFYDVCRTTGSPLECTTDGDTVTVKLTTFESNSAALSEPIKANTSYYYKIVSQVSAPNLGVAPDSYTQFEDRASDYTATAVKATTAKYPFKAPELSRDSATQNSVKLTWNSVAGQTHFAVERSKDTAFARIDKTTCVAASSVGPQESNQTGLSGETTYYFRLKVASDSTCTTARSDYSAAISARTTASVGKIVGDVDGPTGALASMVATAYAGAGPCSDGLADVAGTDRLDSAGNYEIPGLRAGNYCVLLSQVDDSSTYTSPWVINGVTGVPFNEKQKFMHFASIYVVTANGTTTAQTTTVVPGKTVTGTVKSGSTPLANARITVTAAPADPADTTTREVRTIVTTDANGNFTIRGLMGGKYKFVPSKSGYSGSSHWYDDINNVANSYALLMTPN
ncbi:MAG: fibronectin type III domain-containing protein [Actinomycetota bacterium]|nr:fibronectin type III domain-containing protein [Actinomycetota bacterium]